MPLELDCFLTTARSIGTRKNVARLLIQTCIDLDMESNYFEQHFECQLEPFCVRSQCQARGFKTRSWDGEGCPDF